MSQYRSAKTEPHVGYISGNTFRNKRVKYAVIDDKAVFEGDIILGTAEEMKRTSGIIERMLVDHKERAIFIPGDQYRWPHRIIPFTIQAGLPDQNRVTDAIQHWENNTQIRFVQRTNQGSFVTFQQGNECSSGVGMRGGEQFITLDNDCNTAVVIHEIGHTVGLWHEQSREDRNIFVNIVWGNIIPADRHNFDQHITDGDDVGPYDYCSIMHYDRFAFCRRQPCPDPDPNNCPCVGPTIEVLLEKPCANTIGMGDELSDWDIESVRLMYSAFQFIFQEYTALGTTDQTFDFAMTDWDGDGRPDLVAIQKSNTGTNSTEVHIMSGASRFKQFIFQEGTALGTTDQTFDFAMTDWDGDGRPDLVAIQKSNTGTNSTEVHIMSGSSNFKQFVVQNGTALGTTDQTFDFAMTDWDGDGRPDLVAIQKSNTGSNSTEVHIMNFHRVLQ
jgi:hypothetical protein